MSIAQAHIAFHQIFPGKLKKVAATDGGEYAGPCPFCGGVDRFRVWPHKEPPAWWCRQCDKSGDYVSFIQQYENLSFVEACERLNVTPPQSDNGHAPRHERKPMPDLAAAPVVIDEPVQVVPSTKTPYIDLEDYALRHGIEPPLLRAAGWTECEHDGRRALSFPTRNGTRYRFIDGGKQTYTNTPGFKPCWYGLRRALDMAASANLPLVYCNGEASTIAGQGRGVPAFSVAGGGERRLNDAMLKELLDVWDGDIVIALDCDDAGRKAADVIKDQIGRQATIVDLNLSDGGDLADFCYDTPPARTLETLMLRYQATKLKPAPDEIVSGVDALSRLEARLDPRHTIEGRVIRMPFKRLWKLGGLCQYLMPGKLAGVIAPSGHGKTSFVGTLNDLLNEQGHTGFLYSPEWNADEYIMSVVQRQSGVRADRLVAYEAYKQELSLGITPNPADNLTDAEKTSVAEAIKRVRSWPGKMEIFPAKLEVTDTLEQMRDMLSFYRQRGDMVTYVVFDYIQLLRPGGVAIDGDNRHEAALELVKQFCVRNNIVGVVASQVTKSASRSMKDGGGSVDSMEMLYVRDDKLNLAMTLNVQYDEVADGERGIVSRPTHRGVINVTKNSWGQRGELRVVADWPRLRWIDKDWAQGRADNL